MMQLETRLAMDRIEINIFYRLSLLNSKALIYFKLRKLSSAKDLKDYFSSAIEKRIHDTHSNEPYLRSKFDYIVSKVLLKCGFYSEAEEIIVDTLKKGKSDDFKLPLIL